MILLSSNLWIITCSVPKDVYSLFPMFSSKLIKQLSGTLSILNVFEYKGPIIVYSTYLTIFAAIKSMS